MTLDMYIVFGVLIVTIAAFVSDRIRLDLVALLALLALLLTGIITPKEGLAGFAAPIVVMIAGLFVVGGGLFHTGVADILRTGHEDGPRKLSADHFRTSVR